MMKRKIAGMYEEETKSVKCNVCGKCKHREVALFCARCGTKLDLSNIDSIKGTIH